MKQILQNLGNGVTSLTDVPAGRGKLLIRTSHSLISAGTERMLVDFGKAGWIDKARQQPDKVRQVLEKMRTDGVVATVDAVRSKLDQPIALGYCNVGRVLDLGAGVNGFAVGDRVASNGNHAEIVAVPRNLCARIPDAVSDEAAAFTVIGAIGLQGIRLADPKLGECVAVFGLGLIGLLTVQMLRAQGCRVLGIDIDPARLAMAQRFGAEVVNPAAGEDVLGRAATFSRGAGVDAVLITAASKSNDIVAQAAQMSRKRGRIVLIGVVGLNLSRADFYEKELSFQVSCSYGPGRYDPSYEAGGQDYPIGFVRWTEQRNFEAVLDLMASGAIDVAPLISHRFDLDDTEAAFALLTSDEPSLGIMLRYAADAEADARLKLRTVAVGEPTPTRANGTPGVAFLGAGNYAGRVLMPAFKAGGADAWFTADHQQLLGPDYAAADYEPINDILDVWFDSGSTHAFTVEARYGVGTRANLYLEGSDQHRGWFQSSLLESCGTRGRAPYDAVLTHGFALDGQGRKVSKSVGNVVDPLKIINESGADILRLWVASTDYFEDVRIGKEILAGTSDAYRKLRNTFRYLLGALDGFDEAERVAPADMPELERYVLNLLASLDAELREATAAFEFNRYARALSDFANNDLSAFFFDIRKDSLYCDAPSDLKRRSYRTVLDILFHALVRYAAPILCFTAEEVWTTRYPEAGSVHLLTWPEVDAGWRNEDLRMRWELLRRYRLKLTGQIEPLRREKVIGSSLEVDVTAISYDPAEAALLRSADFTEIAIVAKVEVVGGDPAAAELAGGSDPIAFEVAKTEAEKCGRCWRHLPEVTTEGALCDRCESVVHG